MSIVTYRKSCKCTDTTASTGVHFDHSSKRIEGDKVFLTIYEGLGCDRCGKPWEVSLVDQAEDDREFKENT
jgi:hypothetical protein